MNLNMNLGMLLAFLIICLGIGSCTAEGNIDFITYVQGGVSSLTEGTNGTKVLAIADVIPYYALEVANRTIMLPLTNDFAFQLPLNAALVLNGADGEGIYLVTIITWSFDTDKKTLTFDVDPLEFYEGAVLKKFSDEKQRLSADKVGEELSTGVYIEVIGKAPVNSDFPDGFCDPKSPCPCGYCGGCNKWCFGESNPLGPNTQYAYCCDGM
ncbi:hypothetical protein ACKUB1_02925 [Methanospirillum stamsii]|uniref:DUF4382 domain-containing protein n=1 Tax=Methanospirillum stamsii TaxID=1277351 RepID=A0A2V2MR52_9EURY|nr:hypothetical protein [Methanospirillum stamsii]PWR69869.1 hypothetical protein DLD82_16785 [Methanospirillum stamsii]